MPSTLRSRIGGYWQGLRFLAWRFGQERITQTAASLTFTTVISLVPLLAVMLALFTAFPAFDTLRQRLQEWFAQSLLPLNIAQAVLDYLNQFAEKAAGLGAAGVIGLMFTATTLLLTVDRALNLIWRTARPRPFAQRVLLFWAWLTLGPLLLAFGLAQLSLAAAMSAGWLGTVPHAAELLGTLLSWLLMGAILAACYRLVPNTEVLWRDALAGGLLAAFAFNVASRLFAWYIGRLPTYAAVYGTFATVPLVLLWIYVCWLVVLGGALVAAWLPALRARTLMAVVPAGADFLLALQVLERLDTARREPPYGLGQRALARGLAADPQRLERVVLVLEALGWIGQVHVLSPRGRARWTLLVEPRTVILEPLIDGLLLNRAASEQAGYAPGEWVCETARGRVLEHVLRERAAAGPAEVVGPASAAALDANAKTAPE